MDLFIGILFAILTILSIAKLIYEIIYYLNNKDKVNESSSNDFYKNTNKRESQKDKSSDNLSAVFYNAKLIQKKLHENGFENYLYNDFECNMLNNINNSYFLNFSCEELEKKLNSFYISVLKYLKLSPTCKLVIDWSNYDENNNKINSETGMFRYAGYQKEIVIKINKHMSLINAYSIICHECTHYFMKEKKLEWLDTELNEQRTDIITALIGFKNILKKGYYYSYIDDKGVHQCKIGYISIKELKDIEKVINKYRENIDQDKKKK